MSDNAERFPGQESVHEAALRDAARAITDDWATQAPIIEGLVAQTLVSSYTFEIVAREDSRDTTWRVSKGFYRDPDGHTLRLATLMPDRKKRRGDDLEYQLSPTRIIVNENIGHVAATVSYGQVFDNDDEIAAVLPDHPIGFRKMFEEIHATSLAAASSEISAKEIANRNRRQSIARGLRFVIRTAAVLSIGILGVPEVADRYFDYREKQEQKDDIQRQTDEANKKIAIDKFDATYSEIADGVTLEDQARVLVPATSQFVMADLIPTYDEGASPTQLENIRSLRAPEVGESEIYELPITEDGQFTIAHTGDANLLVTAIISKASQTLEVTSIDLDPEEEDGPGEVNIGELVITFANNK